jgi:signal transduction histidine kinase
MPLQQVFHNLINNAIKHHDRDSGTVTLEVERLEGQYRFTVSDDGPGIPAEYQKQIFEMFRTLKSRDEVEGSGMGLALVKKTVERFGGGIEVLSGIERGAAFAFTWPDGVATAHSAKAA